MLAKEQLGFVDVITTEESHSALVHLALQHRTPVICQKPMAPTLELCRRMVRAATEANVPFAIQENFRFQTPLRAAHAALVAGRIGRAYRGHIRMVTGFPVFANQPNLKDLARFILTDMGSHLLDLARFYFGEVESLFAVTGQVHTDIKGEDVATVLLKMKSGAAVTCTMGAPEIPFEEDHFPETFLFFEGTAGTLELGPRCTLRITTRGPSGPRTEVERHPPPRYAWADPDYAVAHTSMVACNADLLAAMTGARPGETNGADNLKTMELVFAAYESAKSGQSIRIEGGLP
jgi:predicted dehydrogenase